MDSKRCRWLPMKQILNKTWSNHWFKIYCNYWTAAIFGSKPQLSIQLSYICIYIRYSDVVTTVPLIQYSSMFVTTPKLSSFYTDELMHMESIAFIQMDESILKSKLTSCIHSWGCSICLNFEIQLFFFAVILIILLQKNKINEIKWLWNENALKNNLDTNSCFSVFCK